MKEEDTFEEGGEDTSAAEAGEEEETCWWGRRMIRVRGKEEDTCEWGGGGPPRWRLVRVCFCAPLLLPGVCVCARVRERLRCDTNH